MRLMRRGDPGSERPAVLLADGTVADIGTLIDDLTPQNLTPAALTSLADRIRNSTDTLPRVPDSARTGPPIAGIGKIVCIGLNYRAHAAEAGQPIPAEPVVFMKAPDTVVGPDDDVVIPPSSRATDYEVELAIVIGSTARYLADESEAMTHVAGYTMSNDVSERSFQLERGGQWDKGKNCETFNPLGPWFVTADDIADPQALRLSCVVNGELRQDSSTADMIFGVAHLVWYVSQFMTLHPGDVINTGTPQGVGMGFSPPRYLQHDDVVEISIDGLGSQRQRLRDFGGGAVR